MNIEILSFGLGQLNNTVKPLGVPEQAGTPIIPITLGYVYDVLGGKSWINPQFFVDTGIAVTLNGESVPLVADAGLACLHRWPNCPMHWPGSIFSPVSGGRISVISLDWQGRR